MLSLPNTKTSSSLSPARLILDLLDADPEGMGTTRRLLAAGEVFSFSHNQMRVALRRLASEGLLNNTARGQYALSATSEKLRSEIQRWQYIEQQRCPWQQDWAAIICGNLAAESSAQFRSQSRALALRGMRRWRPGLWLRPNNLNGGLSKLTTDLQSLGLDAIQGSFLISDTATSTEQELFSLWDTQALNREYQQRLSDVRSATKRLVAPRAPLLIETMELGSSTIRFLLKDPLLPDDLTNTECRHALIEAMQHYDMLGRDLWQQFINTLEL